ncbi:MAG TPA: hypothetical protein VD770_04470 [Coxiellaceae bacterium]|nr:hypothetical protein [Coxiellaceae bacterium]
MRKLPEKPEPHDNEKAQLPKGVLYTFYLGVRSFWAPVDVASTHKSIEETIERSKQTIKEYEESKKLSDEILSRSP